MLVRRPVVHDYCNMETFNASCRPGRVLFIDAARYGRMKIGRCVRSSYGYLGCAVDARRFMDGRCSGRRQCQFVVPDPALYAMQPCPDDFTSYLETAYSCVEGTAAAFRMIYLYVVAKIREQCFIPAVTLLAMQ